MRTHKLIAVAVFLAVFSFLPVDANAQSVELFKFRGTPKNVAPKQRSSPASVREADVDINISSLRDGSAQQISITDFDGRVYTAQRVGGESRGIDGSSWFGKIDGEFDVILTRRGSMVSGLIYTPDDVFELVAKGGRQILVQLDHDLFPECYGDIHPTADMQNFARDPFVPNGGTDSGDRIDVMVLYTTATKNVLGGDAQAQLFAQSAIDASNGVYINSGIRQRLRLVHSEEWAFSETGNSSADLSTLRTNAAVGTLRDTHNADLVAVLAEVSDVCGIGYLANSGLGNAAFGFTITARSCAVGNLSFTHELGHNMGSTHNPENSGSSPVFSYSYGHYVNGSFRTVMSYTNPCSGGCPRLPYFSTPGIFLGGQPAGIENARDNVRSLESMADVIARYRYSGSNIFLNSFNGGERIPRNVLRTLNWTSEGISGDVRIELSRDESRNWEVLTTTANDGSATINISGRPTRRARLRVVSVGSPAVSDSSIKNISIQ